MLPSDDTTLSFRWASSRPVLIDRQVEEDDIHMICKGRRWRFSKAARPLLELLTRANNGCTTDEIYSLASNHLNRETIRVFLKELVANGLIVVSPS